jgi:hypothetical protein
MEKIGKYINASALVRQLRAWVLSRADQCSLESVFKERGINLRYVSIFLN